MQQETNGEEGGHHRAHDGGERGSQDGGASDADKSRTNRNESLENIRLLKQYIVSNPNLKLGKKLREKCADSLQVDPAAEPPANDRLIAEVEDKLGVVAKPVSSESLRYCAEVAENYQKRKSIFRKYCEDHAARRLRVVLKFYMILTPILLVLFYAYLAVISASLERLDSLKQKEQALLIKKLEYAAYLSRPLPQGEVASELQRRLDAEDKEQSEERVAAQRSLDTLVGMPVRLFYLGASGGPKATPSTQQGTNLQLLASVVSDILRRFILPWLAGFLGACIYALRALDERHKNKTLTQDFVVRNAHRRLLGGVMGVATSILFAIPQTSPEFGEGILNSRLGYLFLGFLAGYNVEVAFTLLDHLIGKIRDSVMDNKKTGGGAADYPTKKKPKKKCGKEPPGSSPPGAGPAEVAGQN